MDPDRCRRHRTFLAGYAELKVTGGEVNVGDGVTTIEGEAEYNENGILASLVRIPGQSNH